MAGSAGTLKGNVGNSKYAEGTRLRGEATVVYRVAINLKGPTAPRLYGARHYLRPTPIAAAGFQRVWGERSGGRVYMYDTQGQRR